MPWTPQWSCQAASSYPKYSQISPFGINQSINLSFVKGGSWHHIFIPLWLWMQMTTSGHVQKTKQNPKSDDRPVCAIRNVSQLGSFALLTRFVCIIQITPGQTNFPFFSAGQNCSTKPPKSVYTNRAAVLSRHANHRLPQHAGQHFTTVIWRAAAMPKHPRDLRWHSVTEMTKTGPGSSKCFKETSGQDCSLGRV